MCTNNSNPVLVSISCITYNHASYIRQCLDGFMMQQTNFAFEVLIHDDASTDGTTEIIKEYEAKYPDIIKPLYEEENQWVKGRRGSAVFNFPRAKGKYIALCEGDDYWTDPLKLQKQVDFLEANSEYVMCSHHFNTYNQEEACFGVDWNAVFSEDFTFDLEFFIKRDKWITQPLTILFRRSSLNLKEYHQYSNAKDVTLIYHILKKGKGVFLKDNMGIYRCHDGGIWSKVNRPQQIKEELEALIGIYSVEQSLQAANHTKNRIYSFGYLGISFLRRRRNFNTYLSALKIVFKELGFRATIKSIIRSLNYFQSFFRL